MSEITQAVLCVHVHISTESLYINHCLRSLQCLNSSPVYMCKSAVNRGSDLVCTRARSSEIVELLEDRVFFLDRENVKLGSRLLGKEMIFAPEVVRNNTKT